MATTRAAATAAAPSAVRAQQRLAIRHANPLVMATTSRPAGWCPGPRSRQQAQVQAVAEAQRSMDALFQSSRLKYK